MDPALDILSMSDEEFSNLSQPPSGEAPPAGDKAGEEVVEEAPVSGQNQENNQTGEKTDPEVDPGETIDPETDPAVDPPGETAPAGNQESPAAKGPNPVDPPAEKQEETGTAPDYKALYEQMLAPFKANGKTIQLQSADEAVQLMQMGANYTKKLQELQPYKKFMMMLENHKLLDEERLSFLIDLDKKDPEAIKKLLKDSNIDPIDIDTSEEPKYQGGTHRVTDQEAALQSTIEDLQKIPGGMETLQSLNSWDKASKKQLWDDPQVALTIHAHRTNGIYDRIAGEMERRKALGLMPLHAPFLPAYKAIGDQLDAQGAFADLFQPATQAQSPVGGRVPVATRPAKAPTATKAADNQRVRAAAPPRTAATRVKDNVNPFSLSDEEILKRFADRL